MALLPTHCYQIVLSSSQLSGVVRELSTSAVPFEILSPRELGTEWDAVSFVTSSTVDYSQELALLDRALTINRKSGLLASLIDIRHTATSHDLEQVRTRSEQILSIAESFVNYHLYTSRLEAVYSVIRSTRKMLFFGHDMVRTVQHFRSGVEALVAEYNAVTSEDGEIHYHIGDIVIQKAGDWEYVALDEPVAQLMSDYLTTHKAKDCLPVDQALTHLTDKQAQEIEKLTQFGVLNGQLTSDHERDIALLHASYEMEMRAANMRRMFFSTDPTSDFISAFIAVPNSYLDQFERMLQSCSVAYEDVDWPYELVQWNHKGGLNAFQKVVQSLGTLSRSEVDPTGIVTFFFILFFAFCLSDAVYGLIVAIITGYFLFFTKLKSNFRNIFNLFFFSGLGTVAFGALFNSWAGNLFAGTPANQFFSLFQLIDPLDSNSPAPVNAFLREHGGGSPIIVMLGASIIIGLLNICIGYSLALANAIKEGDKGKIFATGGWLGLIISIIATVATTSVFPAGMPIALIACVLFAASQFVFNTGHGIVGKFVGGLASLYNLIGFFADTLSYTRLVAVGLTSGIIANVINLLAGLVFINSGPILGGVLATIILLFGHIFNLVVALFGAYINPLRLHYVEFLPKFFEGRGRQLVAFDLSLSHAQLVRNP